MAQLPPKLDSDSKLNTQRSKSNLSVPEIERVPKSSASDSKLAVDYFNIQETESFQQSTSPQIVPTSPIESSGASQALPTDSESLCISGSQQSLYVQSDVEDKLLQEVISIYERNYSM